ncbi:2410_t:CDS:2, partial [Scutellospora calospora]
MKTLPYIFIFKVISIFLLIVLPTAFTQTTQSSPINLNYSTFTYSETSSQPNLTKTPPHILAIRHYQDNAGTAVVRVGRVNYSNGTKYCYEQRLLLRVLQANGNVFEINYYNTSEIQDINFCNVATINGNKIPLNFYPLFDQYILVTYTHATNTSDNTTYIDKGMVLNWNGNVMSMFNFGQSYLQRGTKNWVPNEYFVNNIDPRKGFLRLSAVSGINNFEWRQYGYVGNGIFSLLHNDIISVQNLPFTSFQVTVFATLNNGYSIVYANTTNGITSDKLSTQFTPKAGIYAILLSYNQTETSERVILYELPTPNITFSRLICSIDYVFIGHSCIIAATQRVFQAQPLINVTLLNVSTTTVVSATSTAVVQATTPVNITYVNTTAPLNITTSLFYIKVRFLSTGTVLSLDPIYNLTAANVRTLPLGGYALISQVPLILNNVSIANFTFALYNESDKPLPPQQPIIANLVGAFDILGNNTILVALNETSSNAWILLSINVPPLSQYKGTILNLNVLSCTFNDPSGQYFIQMDNNFVKSADYNEPIMGINQNIWKFQTDNNILSSKRAANIHGKLQLTASGSQYFLGLNDSGKQEFFTNLLKELTIIIPTEQGRLSSNNHFQIVKPWSDSVQIIIPLSISEARNDEKLISTKIRDDLNLLINQKMYTGISWGNTTQLLDNNYGFQQIKSISEFFDLNKTKFIWFFVGIIIFLALFVVARIKSRE